VWSKVIFVCHTYNFITIFFWLAIHGFPEGIWLLLEIFSEIIIVADVVLRLVIRHRFPQIWRDMWLLHERASFKNSKLYLIILLMASVPTSLILCLIYGRLKDMGELAAIEFAFLRCVKLLRLDQISLYFEKLDYRNRKTRKPGSLSLLQGFVVVYTFGCATHIIGCAWLFTARLEPDTNKGWFAMDRFNIYAVNSFTKYIEA